MEHRMRDAGANADDISCDSDEMIQAEVAYVQSCG